MCIVISAVGEDEIIIMGSLCFCARFAFGVADPAALGVAPDRLSLSFLSLSE